MSARSRKSATSARRVSSQYQNESDDSDLVQYTSESDDDLDFGGSNSEFIHETQDKATPLSSKRVKNHETSPRTPNRNNTRHTPSSSSRATPQSAPSLTEPTFIMPSMNGSSDRFARGSPMRELQVRLRGQQAQPSRKISSALPKANHSQQLEQGPWHYVNLFYNNVAYPLVAYVLDILGYANRHFLKPILGLALGVGIILLGLQLASGLVYARFNAALAPVCLIPGSSYLFSMCALPENKAQANFEDLINVQSHFEEILDASKDTSALPATIKDSEIAIRDLRTLVKHSRLPSRNQLDLEFHNFVLTAKEAANDLSRYNSRIGAAIDRVIGTNTWTMAVLQGIEEKEANTGSIARIYNAVTGTFIAPTPSLQQRIFDQYISHVSKNKDEITGLIETAQALLMVLTNLDERLDTIYSITVNDDESITKNQDELLSQLWTKLGGNSASVKSNNRHLNLLKNISQYRRKALKHVSETLLKLQEIQAELENLRDGVAAPEILGWREGLPITYHIDLVQKGVERLKVARGESMRVEGEVWRGRIRGSEEGEGMRELPAGVKGTRILTATAKGT